MRFRIHRCVLLVLCGVASVALIQIVSIQFTQAQEIEPRLVPASDVALETLLELRRAGGTPYYDQQKRVVRVGFGAPPIAAPPLRSLDLSLLVKFPNLRELSLNNSTVDGRWIDALPKLEKLERLKTWRCTLGDREAVTLAKVKTLRHLSITAAELTESGVEHLLALEKLESIYLAFVPITDVGLAKFAKLPNLKTLTLSNTKTTPEGISSLEKTRLEQFSWSDDRRRSKEALPYISLLKHLKVFGVKGLTDEDLVHIDDMTSLEELDLSRNLLTDDGLKHLVKLKNLRRLDISDYSTNGHMRITDNGLAHLKELTEIRELDLRGSQITTAGLAHLAGMKKLEKLLISDTPLRSAEVIDLSGFPKLREVGAYQFDSSRFKLPPNCYVNDLD